MYAVRVLIGGDIYVVRVSDRVKARYKADGTPVFGSLNALKLPPYAVLELARDAEGDFMVKWVH